MQYLIKWASNPDSFNSWASDVVWIHTDSIMLQQHRHGRPRRAPCLHSAPSWRIMHVFPTAPWYSHWLAMPARRFTLKTLLEHALLRSNDYKVVLTSFTYPCTWYKVPNLAGQMHNSGCGHFRGPHEPVISLPLQTRGLGDEGCPGDHEWRHLPLQGLPDNTAQLWTQCQGDLAKAPGRLADG